MNMKSPKILTLLGVLSLALGTPSTGVCNPSYRAEWTRLVTALERFTAPQSTPESAPDLAYMPDGENVAILSADGHTITVCPIDNKGKNESTVLFDVANTRETQLPMIEGFELSPDASKILVWTDATPIYRRSKKASYYVYEVRTRLLKPLSIKHKEQRAPLFSPDSRMVAFVDPDSLNIHVAKLDYGSEVAVTRNGLPGKTLYGVPDWTYEEEFATTCSMAWAPDNLTLCYLSYNEEAVPAYTMTLYGGACDARKEYAYYPGHYSYKYPVAGERNATVRLHSYDVETRKIKDLDLPGTASVEYIPRIAYGPDAETLMVCTLNREQNKLEIFRANPKSTVVKSVYTDRSSSWIPEEAYDGIVWASDGFTVGTLDGGNFKYRRVSYQGAPLGEISIAGADLTAYYGDDSQGAHYFQAAYPTPMDRTVWKLDAKGKRSVIGNESGSNTARFAPGMAYALLSQSDITTVPEHSFVRADGRLIRTLDDNKAYASKVAPLIAGISKEFITIPASNGAPELNAYIVKPAGFDSSRKYPVIFSQYSGPGSQQVLNRWTLDWEQYYASQGYVIVCVDPRGTGGRGAEFMQCVYKRLGRLETEDQSRAARYIGSQSWADSGRIGIYGWSYGGYEALMCATQGSNTPFAAAVAVAPVTSWRLYDTVYAERFMSTPGQNADGYNTSAPLNRVKELACPLLVMYGTNDDNVHPANTLEFVSGLHEAGMSCDMLVFPNQNHSINGCNNRAMVWARMLNFFNSALR